MTLLKRLIAILVLATYALNVIAIERVTYYHNDATGSPIAATDQNGQILWTEAYAPYGERLDKNANGEPAYTGKFEEADFGINYFNARWYDPKLGRFLATDPVRFTEDNLQSFNRYAYGNNNPYKYLDPDGNSPLDIGFFVLDTFAFGAAVASGNPAAIQTAEADFAASTVGLLNPVPGTGPAIKALRAADKVHDAANIADGVAKGAENGGLNLFKWGKGTTTKADGWKEGDFMLHLPDKGSPKANWAQNSSRLREEMSKGNPIYDSYRNPVTGDRISSYARKLCMRG